MKKCLFLIDAYVVWCPTWSKNLGKYLSGICSNISVFLFTQIKLANHHSIVKWIKLFYLLDCWKVLIVISLLLAMLGEHFKKHLILLYYEKQCELHGQIGFSCKNFLNSENYFEFHDTYRKIRWPVTISLLSLKNNAQSSTSINLMNFNWWSSSTDFYELSIGPVRFI